jgi:hypothetical protein
MAEKRVRIDQLQIKGGTTATLTGYVLKNREPGYDMDLGILKIGDGVTKWEELPAIGANTTEHFEGIVQVKDSEADPVVYETDFEVIARVMNEEEALPDDIFIVKRVIANDAEGNTKYSHTAYVYDGEKWVAMDGNYNAENVYFDENIAITTEVGNISLTNGQGTIPAEGKNLKQVFESIWTKEDTDPDVTNPSCSISLTANNTNITSDTNYEVGETVTISYTTSFSAGSYQYGPATGVEVTDYTVSNGTDTLTTATGSFDTITMADSNDATKDKYSTYRLFVTAGYSDATAVAKSNLGNETSKKILEGDTEKKYTKYVKSYRKPFWGYKLTAEALVDPTKITSDEVRALPNKGTDNVARGGSGTSVGGVPSTFTVPADTKQVYFAVKAGTKSSLSVKNESSLNAPVAFTKVASGVKVKGANNYDETAYDLWYANFDNATTGSAKLNLTWA